MGGREAPGPLEAEGMSSLGGRGGGAWGLWGRWRHLARGYPIPFGGGFREEGLCRWVLRPSALPPTRTRDLAKEEDLETIGLPLSTRGIGTS